MSTTYDSLLLSCGGGVINTRQQSPQNNTSAALAIGIGGTGVAALAELKKKVYQQLEPDNPGDPIPKYDHIQFLAIDSDTTDIDKMRGKARLNKDSEFFSIMNPSLKAALGAKEIIKENPLLNWMDIDKIDKLLSPQGAGGVRQVGRFLLISKAAALKSIIEAKCKTALTGNSSSSIDVYIFAGISGGTGSGCFIDTCYIVRQALQDNGWNGSGNILGLFFLPDVVLDKPQVKAVEASVKYNSSNGYAAMKELDYLMSLKTANDEFYQNYGNFIVKTQDPPVDMCHLISATKADGSVMPDGFGYGINVAADYVISYLAKVEGARADDAAADDKGLTMRGHLANVNNGVTGLPRKHGAELTYHILGAAAAEIPMTQISTYLAAGFYRRFVEAVGRNKRLTTKVEVNNIVKDLKCTTKDILDSLIRGARGLTLPGMTIQGLKAHFPVARGHLPMPWANAHNAWLDEVIGKITHNSVAMNEDLPRNDSKYDYNRITADSLIGRLYKKLYELSVDSEYGPYYAARFLKCEGYDLISAIDGIITELDEKRKTTELYLHGREGMGGNEELLEQTGTKFMNLPKKKTYADYKEAAEQHALLNKDLACLAEAIKLMRSFKEKAIALSDEFFRTFTDLLDNLAATFKENETFLNSPLAKSETTYTWRIFELEDIKPRLDDVIDDLQPKQLIDDFVRYLLKESSSWINKDEGKISKCISEYMVTLDVFSSQMNRSLQDFLFDKYPNIARDDVISLADQIRDDIIARLDAQATPMFWKDPVFDSEDTFRSSSISVPAIASAVCNAADSYKATRPEFVVRKTGLKDRLFASRFFSGVPFYAYQGTKLLRGHYDEGKDSAYGAGAHLYSQTGRGEDGTGSKNWRSFLPVPTAYSVEGKAVPNGDELSALYEDGVDNGIIIQNASGDYVILQSKPIDVEMPKRDDYLSKDGVLRRDKIDAERKRLNDILRRIGDINDSEVKSIALKNDGSIMLGSNVVVRVRKDYFMHYPVLQQVVRDELDKRSKLNRALSALDDIMSDYEKYDNDLRYFSRLIFFDKIKCADGMKNSVWNRENASISMVYYDYIINNNLQTEDFLKNAKDQLSIAEKYPLYYAFTQYRGLNTSDMPRSELDDFITDHINTTGAKVREGQDLIASKLKNTWNPKAISQLEKDTEHLGPDKQGDIMRFYSGLIREIDEFLKLFGGNLTAPTGASSGAKSQPQSAAPRVIKVWDSVNQRQLTVYEQYCLDQAFDSATNSWVRLNPATMFAWNDATKTWEQLLLDPIGNLMNK